MNTDKDLIERMLRDEYPETLDGMRFSDAEKARLAANIEAEAGRRKAATSSSEESKQRIAKSRRTQMANSRKGASMEANGRNAFFRRPAAAFAAVAICLALPITALAASGALRGHFLNVTDHRGAVVGTTYEQATDEISMSVTVSGDQLTAVATFADSQMAPYSEAEKLGMAAYQIVDADGKVVKEGSAESVEIVNGQAAVDIHLDGVDHGNYTLAVTAFVAEKKADQPLNIAGNWECAFSW